MFNKKTYGIGISTVCMYAELGVNFNFTGPGHNKYN